MAAWLLVALLFSQLAAGFCSETVAPRRRVPLNGEWQFRRDGAESNQWKSVSVPSSFQAHEGPEWHGVGWYRKLVQPSAIPKGMRLLVEFAASATETEVWCNGVRLGSHLGGWTPFRIDLTEAFSNAAPERPQELLLRVDEKVGHNTQGFLPIIAPHFGGLWQDVSLLYVPETHIDDLNVLAVGNRERKLLELEVPIRARTNTVPGIQLKYRLKGAGSWTSADPGWEWDGRIARAQVSIADVKVWSPADPQLYEIELALAGPDGDRVLTTAAFRSIDAFGSQLRLNGNPLQIRGVLNWGYSAPQVDPNAGEVRWREELEFARSRGFNLMKFCLWVPPKRYLELADEMGMLAWMEYPTWHPTLTAKFLEPLQREFREFFAYDRNHPAIVLRSLTCETGPSAELGVIQELYRSAKQMIPGALVEDDSSWIGWNRIHDFYDDHPYGNNHTWVATLAGFEDHILAHGLKPLVLGECMAADTWPAYEQIAKGLGTPRPWYAPGVLDDLPRWESRMKQIAGPGGIDQLSPDSLRYAMLMRKYQAETFRREVPYGGYVISVIRDIPSASMGLIDYTGAPKWSPADWAWQGESMLLLRTPSDRRAFTAGQPLDAEVLLSHFGTLPIANGKLQISLETADSDTVSASTVEGIGQNAGTLAVLARPAWIVPKVSKPTPLLLRALLTSAQMMVTNQWTLWSVPEVDERSSPAVWVHSSVAPALRDQLFPNLRQTNDAMPANPGVKQVVVASQFDDKLVGILERGGSVLLLPNGKPHSFALSSHWFLRGAPYIPAETVLGGVPRDFLLELQHFDLASDVVPDLAQLESFQPWLMLWDTHDQKATVKTHGLVFETRAGHGRLLVSALNHVGNQNPAGRWLLHALLDHLAAPEAPDKVLKTEVWEYLKAQLHAEQMNLVERSWSFRPDPSNEGLALGWQSPEFSEDSGWKPIRIGAWWESQGYPNLDGWAWYRLALEVPSQWQGRKIYVSFEGVDDIYELYVNGKLVGKGGDLATRRDALQDRTSFEVTELAVPGRKVLLAVRVHDWYGAGGIFRPVTLGTLPVRPELDLLK